MNKEEKKNKFYIKHLRAGDFVCGPVGIRMCIGNTKMGGTCEFGKEKLTVSVGDFHKSVFIPEHKYRIDILTDDGVVASSEMPCSETSYFTIETEFDAKFYRVEVFDVDRDLRISIGNPIWNCK